MLDGVDVERRRGVGEGWTHVWQCGACCLSLLEIIAKRRTERSAQVGDEIAAVLASQLTLDRSARSVPPRTTDSELVPDGASATRPTPLCAVPDSRGGTRLEQCRGPCPCTDDTRGDQTGRDAGASSAVWSLLTEPTRYEIAATEKTGPRIHSPSTGRVELLCRRGLVRGVSRLDLCDPDHEGGEEKTHSNLSDQEVSSSELKKPTRCASAVLALHCTYDDAIAGGLR
jgi:hypothetical protein